MRKFAQIENKFYSPGQKNQCYLFCIMRKFVQCGKYFRSHAVPPYTSFTVHRPNGWIENWDFGRDAVHINQSGTR
jgi:hypothetical protein